MEDIAKSPTPLNFSTQSPKTKSKKKNSPKSKPKSTMKRSLVKNYSDAEQLCADRINFEKLCLDPSLNNIKQDILDCLRVLSKQYKNKNYSNKMLGYFIYLLYFTVIEKEDFKHKITNGIVFCKILKHTDSDFKQKIYSNIKKPEALAAQDNNLDYYLEGLKMINYPAEFIPETEELK